MKKFITWQLIITVIIALVLGFFDMPNNLQEKVFPWAPAALKDAKIHLGLDLQGGSQLDYKIDLSKVPAKDQDAIIDGVRTVIEKRVNALGVAEPSIYTSDVGAEKHIIVELAAVKDLEEAKKTVGKTIQLEFKEAKTEPDPDEKKRQEDQAASILKRVQEPKANFELIGKEEEEKNKGKVTYTKDSDFTFVSDLGESAKSAVEKLKAGEIASALVSVEGEYIYNETTQSAQKENGVEVVRLVEKDEAVKNKKEVKTAHILISYKGASGAPESVTRTEDEAKKLAEEVRTKALGGEDFAKLAKQYSDDPGTKDNGGVLDVAVTDGAGLVQPYKDASLKLQKAGELSDVTKSEFGFHTIKALEVKADMKEPRVKLEKIFVSTMPDQWKSTGLNGEHFVRADVQVDQIGQPYVSIKFDDKGAKMFEDLTARLVNKQIAIFVGGNLISAPNVKEKIGGGTAQISGTFTFDQAKDLAQNLNTGAIPAPILLTGQHTIGSTLGQDALGKSIKAGIIGFLVVALFMILYYRLPGLLATIALGMYSIILIFIIKSALPPAAAILISLCVFAVLIYKIFNSKDGTWEKFFSLILSVLVLIFMTWLLESPITLTLAGVAGVILSIGMAVDANILIFERIKEELRDGHTIASAIDHGFNRAWDSIRDSNFSSLITCGILFYFGSSLIRGFALNLAAGILISMFSAITLTRTFLRVAGNTSLGQKTWLFGVKRERKESYKIIEKSKLFFIFSGTLMVISIVSALVFGVKLGLDFTGGTFSEFKFDKTVTVEQLKAALPKLEQKINVGKNATDPSRIDLSGAQIVPGGDTDTLELKTKYLTNEMHDKFITELKNELGGLQELRFQNVGATIGNTMKTRAVAAIILASIMIIVYLSIVFRRVPREVSSWRFGVCAVVALIHDLLITFGLFVLLGHFKGVEIDALFITAMLTVLGFSVHDTIVVFDRLREHLLRGTSGTLTQVINRATTETMARSINTSVSTLIALGALLIFGSESIFYFILALFFGIIFGTYSSIGVATALLATWVNKGLPKDNAQA